MKFSVTSVLSIALAATAASAAVQPEATPAAVLEARQAASPIDLSSLLGDPSSALAQASSLLAQPAISSAFRSMVTESAYQSQVSAAIISQYGSETGQAALQSYSQVIASLLGESASAPTSSQSSSGSSSSGSGSGNAASGLVTLTAMGSAMVAGAAAVMAML